MAVVLNEIDTQADIVTSEQAARALARVEERLEAGYRKIEEALAQGQDVARWETLWLRLLDEYEQLYRVAAA